MKNELNRRQFLKGAAALGGLAMLPACASAPRKGADLNGKLNVAIVGPGGRGSAAVGAFGSDSKVQIVAFCDVDDVRAAGAYKKFPNVPRFKDYRVMMDKMGKDIDAVAVCTPDHMHYPISLWAIANGKHVYCEKPLCRTMWECRALQKAASKAGVFTQMGNQGHTFDGWRQIREWYEAGIFGEIKEIYHWTDRPHVFWPQGDLTMPPGQPVPATLDYDLWLGVAPYQPYNNAFVPFKWRGLRNYGTGAIGDMACHFMDVPYSAFDLGYPSLVTAKCTKFNNYSWPAAASIIYDFPAKGKRGPVKLYWYDGYRKPRNVPRVEQSFIDDKRNANCTIIVGTKQTVTCGTYGEKPMIHPRANMVELAKAKALPAPYIPRIVGGPHINWAHSILEGKQPVSNFDYAAPFTEVVLLGTVAMIAKQPLQYDPETMTFPNCPEADKYVKSLYAYRREFLPS